MSGKSVIAHSEAKRMLRDVRDKKISVPIFSKLARLARNTKELLDFADIFRDCAADLVSLQESIDTSTPAGRLFYTMIAAMATGARGDRRLRGGVRRSESQAREEARWSRAFRLSLRRQPTRSRSEGGTDRAEGCMNCSPSTGASGPSAASSTTPVTHAERREVWLHDRETPPYRLHPAGRHRLNYAKSLGDKKRWVLKPEAEWEFQAVQPIVSDDLWNRVNAMLTERRGNRKPPSKKAKQLFAGVVYCDCGGKMYVPSNTPKYVCFACTKKPKNKIPITDLENVFQSQLRDFFFSPEQIAEHLQSADTTLKEKGELLAAMEGEQAKLRTEGEKLYQLYLADQLSKESFGTAPSRNARGRLKRRSLISKERSIS